MARGRRGRASGAAAAAVLCGAAALLGGAAADKSDGFSLQELEVEDTHKVECERPSKNGDRLSMHYTGTLENGKKVRRRKPPVAALPPPLPSPPPCPPPPQLPSSGQVSLWTR